MRTADNCMPAVTTELEYTTDHLLRFMIQTGRFRNLNGTIAQDRVDAAKEYLKIDWDKFQQARLAKSGFDPEQPNVDKIHPDWRLDSSITTPLETYLEMKKNINEQMQIIQSGPDKEFTRATNALLMTQRVDLWCAGEKEVELAVQHLYKLGRLLNDRETFFPVYIQEFYPGAEDI